MIKWEKKNIKIDDIRLIYEIRIHRKRERGEKKVHSDHIDIIKISRNDSDDK